MPETIPIREIVVRGQHANWPDFMDVIEMRDFVFKKLRQLEAANSAKYAVKGVKIATAFTPAGLLRYVAEFTATILVEALLKKMQEGNLTDKEAAILEEAKKLLPEGESLLDQAARQLDETATDGALSIADKPLVEGLPEIEYDPIDIPLKKPDIDLPDVRIEVNPIPERGIDIDLIPPPLVILPSPDWVILPEFTPNFTEIPEPLRTPAIGPSPGEIFLPRNDPDYRPTGVPIAVPNLRPGTGLDIIPPVKLSLHPGLKLKLRVGESIKETLKEENTKRKDLKPKGMWYLVALRFVNRTWGTLTELDDFSIILQDNLIFTEDTVVCIAGGTCIVMKAGQRIGDTPLNYKAQAISQVAADLDGINFTWEHFIIDFFKNELQDRAIGMASNAERALINQADLRGILDYGNLTTWYNRFKKIAEGVKSTYGSEPITPPPGDL